MDYYFNIIIGCNTIMKVKRAKEKNIYQKRKGEKGRTREKLKCYLWKKK